MKKLFLLLLPFVMVLFICFTAETIEVPGDDYPKAPEFTLEDLNGNKISLSDLKGKVIFLNFWATWCPPCEAEIPHFIEVYKEYKDQGMEIIGISVDSAGPKSVIKFAEKYKINYPVVMYTLDIIKGYRPGNAIPVTIIIGPNGKIRHKKVGYTEKKYLTNWFLKLIKEK